MRRRFGEHLNGVQSTVTVGYEHSVEYVHCGCSSCLYIELNEIIAVGFILKCEPAVIFGKAQAKLDVQRGFRPPRSFYSGFLKKNPVYGSFHTKSVSRVHPCEGRTLNPIITIGCGRNGAGEAISMARSTGL